MDERASDLQAPSASLQKHGAELCNAQREAFMRNRPMGLVAYLASWGLVIGFGWFRGYHERAIEAAALTLLWWSIEAIDYLHYRRHRRMRPGTASDLQRIVALMTMAAFPVGAALALLFGTGDPAYLILLSYFVAGFVSAAAVMLHYVPNAAIANISISLAFVAFSTISIGTNEFIAAAVIIPMFLGMLVVVIRNGFASFQREMVANFENLELLHKVEEQALRLQETQFQLVQSEKSAERLRLMRDIHDGVGTQLAVLVGSLRGGGMTTEHVIHAVNESLSDLHLIVDVRGAKSETLADALADFRYRLEPKLTSAGVTLSWQMDSAIDAISLSQEANLHILRIVQECCANAIRHAVPDRIIIRGEVLTGPPAERRLIISIVDNGGGLKSQGSYGGKGLANVAARAASLGAQFTLDGGEVGTTARLQLPLHS